MSESSRKAEEFMKKYFGNILKENKNEITIDDSDEIDAPFFRNNTGYRAVIEDKKIKKLIAHYYYNA